MRETSLVSVESGGGGRAAVPVAESTSIEPSVADTARSQSDASPPDREAPSHQVSVENPDQVVETGPIGRVMDRWNHWWKERKTRKVEAKLNKAELDHQSLTDEATSLRTQAEQHLALKLKKIEALTATLGEAGVRQAKRQIEEEAATLRSQAVALETKRDKRAPKLAELRQRDSEHQQALQTLEQRINKPFEVKQEGYRAEVQKLEEALKSYFTEIKELEAQWEKAEKRQEELKKEMKASSSSQEKSLKKQEGKRLKEENGKRLNWIMKLKNETVELTDRRKHLNYQILMLEYRKAKRKNSPSTVDVGKLLA